MSDAYSDKMSLLISYLHLLFLYYVWKHRILIYILIPVGLKKKINHTRVNEYCVQPALAYTLSKHHASIIKDTPMSAKSKFYAHRMIQVNTKSADSVEQQNQHLTLHFGAYSRLDIEHQTHSKITVDPKHADPIDNSILQKDRVLNLM